jgi:hypothetical protein
MSNSEIKESNGVKVGVVTLGFGQINYVLGAI